MTKLVIDLHNLKTQLELIGSLNMAAQVEKQLQRQMSHLCHFCQKPVSEDNLKSHPECLSQLYDFIFEEKKTA